MEVLSKNKIKWIRSLRLKKNRDSSKLFIVEGTKMVKEIMDQWSEYIDCLITTNPDLIFDGVAYRCSEVEMKNLTALRTPSSLLAVVRQPEVESNTKGLTLALDGIQDPGNMGTIIRTADWFGVTSIVCSKETVDIFNPKVIQSSMGSLFRVSCVYTDLKEYLKSTEKPIYGALMEGKPLNEIKHSGDAIIVMGNEGNGVSEVIANCVTEAVHIPGKGGAESLNVAVATGIILAELSK